MLCCLLLQNNTIVLVGPSCEALRFTAVADVSSLSHPSSSEKDPSKTDKLKLPSFRRPP